MTPQSHARRKQTPTWCRGAPPPGGTVILGELVTAGARLTHKQPGRERCCPRRCLGQAGEWPAPRVPELHPACLGEWGGVPSARDSGSAASTRFTCHRGASCPQIGLCPWAGAGWGPARPREVPGGVQSSSPAGRTQQQVPEGHCVHPGEDGRRRSPLSAGHSPGPPRPRLPRP